MSEHGATGGYLSERIERAYEHALERGAIMPLQTQAKPIPLDGAHFVVKCISSLSQKDKTSNAQASQPGSNPFLSYDKDLFVAELSASHVLLLNKFPIERAHALAVTRSFVPQTAPLDATDFDAAATLLLQTAGLAAYNGGRAAGASQSHRHLHFVPSASAVPLQPLFSGAGELGAIEQVDAFRFVHAFIRLDKSASDGPALAFQLQRAYEKACRFCSLTPVAGEMPPYNLLATREWLLLVPRSQECWTSGGESVSLNAFSYAGMLAVRSARQLQRVEGAGLWAILEAISITKP